ncbi:MAG TPA: saccharopine dehydrogenase C-terminal domain-containing protein [Burkholderiaceae bacterium]|jgi:homospermidine synthase|nr:saccharopine dehydrogenase C-terminal domain-containing protein [Burkholderiaceae bacterium]
MPQDSTKHARPPGNIIFIGCGSVGQGTLPLVLRHLDATPAQLAIITSDERGSQVAEEYGVRFIRQPLEPGNYRQVLDPWVRRDSFVVNLSVEVASTALIELCQQRGALYLDTCIEPWKGAYTDASVPPAQRSNYALREAALGLRAKYPRGSTAILAHGANPGMVSHVVKQALMNLQRDLLGRSELPNSTEAWARLAMALDVKTIHIAERDTQVSRLPKRAGEFVNTWSCDAFVSEGCQPAEMGWGTHERLLPADGALHDAGGGASIYLMRPGASVRVRSWTPLEGPYQGFLITHNESISIADHLTVREGDRVRYRPTCHYAYHPCDNAVLSLHELAGKNFRMQTQQRIMRDDISDGIDELGVLLAGHARNAYWYGSQLSIEEARALAPYNNATSLQVCCAVLAGIVWAIENPRAGVVEADDLDFERNLQIMRPYLGQLVGHYTDWTPLTGRSGLFPEDLDTEDPWQFKNIRVT